MSTDTQSSALRQPLPQPKFSRYRSVRHAHAIAATSNPTPPSRIATTRQDASVARSLSGYHGKAKSADTTADTTTGQRVPARPPLHYHSASLAALTGAPYPIPAVQDAQHASHKTVSTNDAPPSSAAPAKSIPKSTQRPTPSPAVYSEKVPQTLQSSLAADLTVYQISMSKVDMDDEASEKLRAEEERIRRIKAKQKAAREFQHSKGLAPADRTRLAVSERDASKANVQQFQGAEPTVTLRRRDRTQGPAEDEAEDVLPAHTRSAADNDTTSHEMRDGRRQDPATAEVAPRSLQNLSPRHKLAPNGQAGAAVDTQPSIPSVPTLEPADSGPVSFDMPRSAVNAGERRLVVKYQGSVISLPITPATTSQDILDSASTMMSNRFDPQQSLLLESFTQLGLERPLRKYEHVRDIMNSWDYDTQNHLFVTISSPHVLSKGGVDPRALPKRPSGASLYMYHSQRPGKWDKRWVSLKEDGQISMSKRQDGLESSSLCHLSDFDIYKPTRRQMKKLNPPKKTCFAIKSQQKSAMFLNGANFVHFFATSEGPLTETWYSAIRTWRSWYLVDVLGAGQDRGHNPFPSMGNAAGLRTAAAAAMSPPDDPISPQRTRQPASGPLETGSPTKSIPKAPSSKAIQSRDLGQVSLRGRSAPPSSFPNHQIHQFDPSNPSSAPKRPPSLIRRRERTASMRSDAEAPSHRRRSSSLSRAGSTRQAPKPLLDLTPQFQEQPQHLKKGRGVAPIPGMPLVALATDVEALPGAISIPTARAWQRPQERTLDDGASVARTMKSARGVAAPRSENVAFTGTGLLSRSKSRRTRGGIGHGYGLKTGDRNHVGEPLVDLSTTSHFANGSLLRQVETFRGEAERGLIIDRTKRTEADVRVGEGSM
jgi:hypothetical protein